eukprot:CAMPEP_0114251722 /NCGR_PEP_ID=MMETSP0058-20121206/15428_1 /TAXON_ID=36894 /ORGANISM="Pyramimonas parkeae, CCMP726" /LENGTH=384 /DNA_ID=CAMNT_0001365555 /DNA_START=418 /DNA_END=1572 /DNA_ORIENTATION=-
MALAGEVLMRLQKHKHAWVFNQPVNAKAMGLDDYHDIVKQPMDLHKVRVSLRKGEFQHPSEVADMVRLVFKNAVLYNPQGSDVHTMALQMSAYFEQMWEKEVQRMLDDRNEDVCRKCQQEGTLLLCDFCPAAYHIECLGLSIFPPEDQDWKCIECLSKESGPAAPLSNEAQVDARPPDSSSTEDVASADSENFLANNSCSPSVPCVDDDVIIIEPPSAPSAEVDPAAQQQTTSPAADASALHAVTQARISTSGGDGEAARVAVENRRRGKRPKIFVLSMTAGGKVTKVTHTTSAAEVASKVPSNTSTGQDSRTTLPAGAEAASGADSSSLTDGLSEDCGNQAHSIRPQKTHAIHFCADGRSEYYINGKRRMTMSMASALGRWVR